jgi:hypothetical protein
MASWLLGLVTPALPLPSGLLALVFSLRSHVCLSSAACCIKRCRCAGSRNPSRKHLGDNEGSASNPRRRGLTDPLNVSTVASFAPELLLISLSTQILSILWCTSRAGNTEYVLVVDTLAICLVQTHQRNTARSCRSRTRPTECLPQT